MSAQNHLRLLIIEEDPEAVSRLRQLCEAAGYTLDAAQVRSAGEFQEALRRQPWDLILSAHRLSGYSAKQALRLLARLDVDVPLVVVDSRVDAPVVAQAMHAGARDVVSPACGEHLQCVVKREVADLGHRRAHEHYARLIKEYEQRLTYFLGRMEDHPRATPARESAHEVPAAASPPAVSPPDGPLTASPSGAPGVPEHQPPDNGNSTDNLVFFHEALTNALNTPVKHYKALLMIELDRGAALRGQFGDDAVRDFLTSVEQLLHANLTEPHALALCGDFTYAVLACHDEAKGLVELAEGVRRALEAHVVRAGGQAITSTASIGICVIDKQTTGAAQLMARAKSARDKAKAKGGNRISVACMPSTPSSEQGAAGPDGWAAQLRGALAENRFRLVYQPVVNFHAEPSETYEILLRMLDEHGLEILPATFIPKAQERGLMPEIDRWVVKTAVETLLQRRNAGYDTRFFVKLSRASVDSAEFLPWLGALLRQTRLPGKSLILQLSEGDVAAHFGHAKDFMNRLTAMQCAVALDHFGAHKDSVALIRDLPVQYLKINGHLVQALSQGAESENRLRELVEPARAMGKITIATFVQDPYILSILWRCGVDYVQGFYFQPPEQSMAYDFSAALT